MYKLYKSLGLKELYSYSYHDILLLYLLRKTKKEVKND